MVSFKMVVLDFKMLDVGNSSLNLYSSYYSIGFQEHLLQIISWVSLMQVRLAYLGIEQNNLKMPYIRRNQLQLIQLIDSHNFPIIFPAVEAQVFVLVFHKQTFVHSTTISQDRNSC